MRSSDLDWREKLVLQAFEGRTVLRYCDLPPGVGHKTMEYLVDKGIVRIATADIGPHASEYGWLLVH